MPPGKIFYNFEQSIHLQADFEQKNDFKDFFQDMLEEIEVHKEQ